jgi:hypothetical protein
MNEIQYKDIFKNPETIQNLKGKSVTSRERMLGNERLGQILQRSMVLISQLAQDEAPYKAKLEKLAVDMVKEMYPVIDEFGIEIEASLGNDQLSPSSPPKEEEEEMDFPSVDLPSTDIMNDEVAKRRLINAITQGASIRGALDKPFMDFLNEVPKNLLDSYSETLAGIENSVDKYGETLKKVFGVFHDEEALAMFLAMLAGGGGGGSKGGESEAEYDKEEGKLKIRATGIIFPFLVHEIIKGLYEIVSLQGFTKSKKTNQAVADTTDKLEYEPEDFAFGTHIQEMLEKLYNEADVRNKIAFELFLANLYREDDAKAFVEFIENLINNKLTSSQKRWALNYMEPASDEEDNDEDVSLSDLGLEENKKPYNDLKVTDEYIIREFNENIDPIELMWHRDNEKRTIETVGKTDWKIQLDDQLPKSLNEQVVIPKHMWHRVIKGTVTLTLKIYKK